MSKHEADDRITFEIIPQKPKVPVGENTFQLDDEGYVIGGKVQGHVIEKIEGGMKVTRPDGSTMVLQDGNVTIENIVPKSVGIQNLSEIESFAVRTQDQTRIYRLDFFGGGHAEVTYSQDGRVMEVTGQGFKQSITKDNEIIVSQGDSVSAPVH